MALESETPVLWKDLLRGVTVTTMCDNEHTAPVSLVPDAC